MTSLLVLNGTRANLSCLDLRTVVEDAMLLAAHDHGRLDWDELLEVAFEALEDVVGRGVPGTGLVSQAVFLLHSHGEDEKLTTVMQQVTEVALAALGVLTRTTQLVAVGEGRYVASAAMRPPAA